MKLLLVLPLLFATLYAEAASVRKSGKFDRYVIEQAGDAPFRFTLSTVVVTKDGCNHFGLAGGMRPVQYDEGTTLEQTLVADLFTIQTEMACKDLETPRRIPLESEEYVIHSKNGRIYATVLVPEDMALKVK